MVDFRDQVSENGTRTSRFLADCNGVAADRLSRVASRESFPGAGRRCAYRRRISLPFGIHIDRLSPSRGLKTRLLAGYGHSGAMRIFRQRDRRQTHSVLVNTGRQGTTIYPFLLPDDSSAVPVTFPREPGKLLGQSGHRVLNCVALDAARSWRHPDAA